jgi:reactive chlorine resistance protein C
MGTRHTPASGLASLGFSVTRGGLATCFLWIGALKFKDYEVENAEPLVTASPLTSLLREKLGAQKLARLIGVTQITLGSLIAAKPFAPRASAVGSFGAAGMMLGTLSFLATTPEAWQEGQGMPQLSLLGEALLKDGVLLGASLLTAADSLRAARAGNRPSGGRPATGYTRRG